MTAKNNYYLDDLSLRIAGDENIDHNFASPPPNGEHFKLYTMDLSYYSGKMEMFMRYKQIPFQRIEPTAREYESILAANTGCEQLPQLYDCRDKTYDEDRWLRDTSPMIEYLDNDYPNYRVTPNCKVHAFFHKLIEDYVDEYLWRPAMFFRWEPSFDNKVMGLRFCYEFGMKAQNRLKFVPMWMRPTLLSLRQWLLSSYGEDCTTKEKKMVVVNQYYELLDVLEEILSKQPYLFGNKPTLVDFAFMGPFFRHFSSDFTPRKIMQLRAPAVYEWVARMWNAKGSKFDDIDSGFPTPGCLPGNWNRLMPLLSDYMRYSHANAIAFRDNKKFFNFEDHGKIFKVPVVHYRAWCRQNIQYKYTALSRENKSIVQEIMESFGCWEYFIKDKIIKVEPECGTEPPFCCPPDHDDNIVSYKWNATSVFVPWFFTNGYTKGIVATGLVLIGSYGLYGLYKQK